MPSVSRPMLLISVPALEELCRRIFQAPSLNIPAEAIEKVVQSLVMGQIEGFESHGVSRCVRYCNYVRSGQIDPHAELSIVRDSGRGTMVVDGNRNFGQVSMFRIVDLVTEKMKTFDSFSLFGRGINHVGRLYLYARELAKRGFIVRLDANAVGRPTVAVFGSSRPRMGTEPTAWAVPLGPTREPLVYDASTAAIVEGNVNVLRIAGAQVPDGLLLNCRGEPTMDPNAIYIRDDQSEDDRGCIRPRGGAQGYTASGISFAINLVAGVLTGSGVNPQAITPGTNGISLQCTNPASVMDPDEFYAQSAAFIDYVKGARRLHEPEILIPGEGSARRRADAIKNGTPLDAGVYRDLCLLATELAVDIRDISVTSLV